MPELFEREKEVSLPIQRQYSSVTAGAIGMVLKYIGAQVYADVAVAAGGDVTFSHGASVGAKIVDADPLLGIDSAGAATVLGVIDLSTPNAVIDTYRELAARINGSLNWRCELGDVVPSWLTNNTLITLAATEVTGTTNGLALFLDNGAVVLKTGIFILPVKVTQFHLYGDYVTLNDLSHNPTGFLQRTRLSVLSSVKANATFASGAATLKVYHVRPDGTEVLIYTQAGGATTVENSFLPAIDGAELRSDSGGYLVVAYESDTAAITAGYIDVRGRSIKSGVTSEPFNPVSAPYLT